MHAVTKSQISRLTLQILMILSGVFIVSTVVLVLCAGLGINPFKESTTVFLFSAFVGAIGLGVATFLLNVAVNVSLIADTQLPHSGSTTNKSRMMFWLLVLGGITVAIVVAIFLGTVFSEKKYLSLVHSQAEEVLNNNDDLLKKIGSLLKGGAQNLREITRINKYLSNQRADLPELTLIYSGSFEGKMALYELGTYVDEDEKKKSEHAYYQCSQSVDCDYLRSFFSGKKTEVFKKYTRRNNMFWIYFPFEKGDSKFVLMFSRRESYGKIGS